MVHPFADTDSKAESSAPTPLWAECLTPGWGFVKTLIERSCEYRLTAITASVDFERTNRYADSCSRVKDSGDCMARTEILIVGMIAGAAICAGCGTHGTGPAAEDRPVTRPAAVDEGRIIRADEEPGNWMTYGRTYGEQRFSPLKEINDKNIGQLGLAWFHDLDTRRGQEATPIVVDGVMYFTTAWSKVFALHAASGTLLWSYDPQVMPEWAVNACCDVVNRGVAVWGGKVFFGTLDGRLIALDAATGKLAWEKLTIDRRWRYTITGAPRMVKGRVIIGNGGAEMGVRGYVSAYDAESGEMVCASTRFRAIQRNHSKIRLWRRLRRHGRESGGSTAAAGRCGTRLLTIRNSIFSTLGPATAGRGTPEFATRAAAIIFSLARLWRSNLKLASTFGTTRKILTKLGTTTRMRTLFWLT
jgi:outer membrane protein assembly factor BamB